MDFSEGAAWMKGQIIPVAEASVSVFDWGLTRSDITRCCSCLAGPFFDSMII